MTGPVWASGVMVSLIAWALYLDLRRDASGHLARWFVKRARGRVSPAPFAFCIALGALLAFAAVIGVSALLAQAVGSPRGALPLALPAMLAYAPFVFVTMPVATLGDIEYHWRDELSEAGAGRRLQRRIAWTVGPLSALGAFSIAVTCLAIFNP